MPSIKLKMFRLKDPLEKTRRKKVLKIRTEPITQSMEYISDCPEKSNILTKTKS